MMKSLRPSGTAIPITPELARALLELRAANRDMKAAPEYGRKANRCDDAMFSLADVITEVAAALTDDQLAAIAETKDT